MYLIDTNVISELRKKGKANQGVVFFFERLSKQGDPVYLSSITVGELRRGIELIRHRGDIEQSQILEKWFVEVLENFGESVLDFDQEAAQIWGKLRVPNPTNEIDKQIAAIALINDLTLVTRNVSDFNSTGVKVLNPFH